MNKIDREEAHRRVDAYYDALDARQAVNDPDRDAEARDAAFAAYKLVREIGADLVAERLGAARLARYYFRATVPWGVKAREAAAVPVAPAAKDIDQDEAAAQRWMVARYLIDSESDLPAGLALNIAGGLLLLNVGSDAPIFRRYRVQGLPPGAGFSATRDAFVAFHVYYLAGYRDCSLEDVLLAEAHAVGGLNANILNKNVRKLRIGPGVAQSRQNGRSDRMAGVPEASPYVSVIDLAELANINKRKP
jgi:hypothetical protein